MLPSPRQMSCNLIKRMAILRVEETVHTQLHIKGLINLSTIDFGHFDELSREVFSWSFEAFLKRRQLKNTVWLNVLLTQFDSDTLEKCKFIWDLSEMMRHLSSIFNALYRIHGNQSIDINETVWKPLSDSTRFLSFEEALNENYIKNKKKEMEVLEAFEAYKRKSKRIIYDPYDDALLNDIEFRYKMDYMKSAVDQTQVCYDLMVKELSDEIMNTMKTSQKYNDCSHSVMLFLMNETEKYRYKIEKLYRMMNQQNEIWSAKLVEQQLQINKLRENYQFLKDEYKRFDERIAARLLLEERRRLNKKKEEAPILPNKSPRRGKKRKN